MDEGLTWNSKLLKLSDLKEYEFNPRRISKEAFTKLVESLKEDGYHGRIMINLDYTIIGGHQRKLALLAAGFKPNDEIEVLFPNRELTPDELDRLNIRDNLPYGEFDFDMLADRFDSETLVGWGMPEDWLPEIILDPTQGLTDGDAIPGLPNEPISKLGDLYILGNHRLLCGDSTSITDVEKLMGGEKADMVFTDPPYNLGSDSKGFAAKNLPGRTAYKEIESADWDKDFNIEDALASIKIAVKPCYTAYIWTSHFLAGRIWEYFKQDVDNTNYLVWSKPNPMPSMSKRHPTWNTELCVYITNGSGRTVNFPKVGHFLSCRDVVKKSDGTHPTQKPIELIEPILEFSSNRDQIVLDLFGGSGSTLIACENLKRKCFMMELDPKYIDVIVKRWEDFTGKKSELVTTQDLGKH